MAPVQNILYPYVLQICSNALVSKCGSTSSFDSDYKGMGSEGSKSGLIHNVCSCIQMKQRSAVEKLRPLLQGGPTIRHHACRALVYLGEMETDGVSLFQRGNGRLVL